MKNEKRDSSEKQLGNFLFNIRDKVEELIQRHEELCRKKDDFILLNDKDDDICIKEVKDHDIIVINAGGSIFRIRRDTLTIMKGSRLDILFSGKVENKLLRDESDHIFFDIDPYYFEKVIESLFVCKLLHGEEDDCTAPKLKPKEKKIFQIYWSYFTDKTLMKESKDCSVSLRDIPSINTTNTEALLDGLVKNLEEELHHLERKCFTENESFVSYFISGDDSNDADLGPLNIMNLLLPNGEKLQVKKSTLCQFKDSKFTKDFSDDKWLKAHTFYMNEVPYILIEQPAAIFKAIINYLRLKALLPSSQEIPLISVPSEYNEIFEKVINHQFPNNAGSLFERNKFNASNIITTCNDGNQIMTWLGSVGKTRKLKLLYRGSKHGWKVSDFHKECNGKGATLTVVKTKEGYIFGGYTDCSWNSSNGSYQSSTESFLFSLKCHAGLGAIKINIKSGQEGHATCSYASYGPVFGAGHDICIGYPGDFMKQGHTCIGQTYELPIQISNTFLIGKAGFNNLFDIEEVEVFQV